MEYTDFFSIAQMKRYYHIHNSKGYVFYGHIHEDIEINVVLSGKMELTCGEKIYTVCKNSVFIIPSGIFHCYKLLPSVAEHEMIVVHISKDASACNCFKGELPIHSITDDNTQLLVNMFCEEIEQRSLVSAQGECIKVSDTARKLLEIALKRATENSSMPKFSSSTEAVIYSRAVGYMADRLSESIKIHDVAKECGVCDTTLKRIFSKYTGAGVAAYFNNMKMEQSRKMLLQGKSCAQVSEMLGFSSQAYFSKCFKRFYNINPSRQFKNSDRIIDRCI